MPVALCQTNLTKQLKRLSEGKHCPIGVPGQLKLEKHMKTNLLKTPCSTLELRGNAKLGKHPAVELSKLAAFEDGALLTVLVNVSYQDRLLSYNVGLHGKARGGRKWYARIDLHEANEDSLVALGQKGYGYATHPLLHLQFGAEPNDRNELPAPRVPLPWLKPWEALAWLVATAEQKLEPERFGER